MNSKPHLDPDHPAIQAAFSGVYKSGKKLFFRINAEGHHQKIAVVHALDHVPITYENKMSLIASFPFQLLDYCSERMKANAAVVARRNSQPVTEEEDLEDDEDADSVSTKKNPEFFLVRQNNGFFGCFSAREGNVVAMFKTEPEATSYIRQLLQGASHVRGFYGSKAKVE